FDPSTIPIPGPPPAPPGSSDQQSAWANASAALSRVQPAPHVPQPPSFPPVGAQPFPWLMQQYATGLAAAAASNAYPQHNNYGATGGGNWNATGPARPQNTGWNGQNRVQNQFNQQKTWNLPQQQPKTWQPQQGSANGNQNGNPMQQGQQQWNNRPGNFKSFGFNKPVNGRLPHLQNSFVKQGGGPMDNGEQVCEKAPQFGNVPESVRKFMERSLAAAPSADHAKVLAYLEARLRPVLQSGSARFVNWDNEPLPHTKNYELTKTWTPSASNAHKANPVVSPVKTPASNGFSWASPPKDTENRRRKRRSSSSPDSDRKSEKRGWYEDREARSPSIEITGETKVGGGKSGRSGKWEERVDGMKCSIDGVSRFQYLSKKEKKQLLQKEKAQKKAEKKFSPLQQQSKSAKKDKKPLHFNYVDPQEHSRKADRMRRFAQDVAVAAPAVPYRPSRNHIVVGTSTEIEKKYFRLTAAPDPTTVRPLEILKKSLHHMKEQYRKSADYRFMCDQFRSIRQDLTVQRIRNNFTVEVYEIHARIALENKDREEFNKCQSQLKVLYEEVDECPNEPEFTAYRLLYSVAMGNNTDVATILQGLSNEMREEKCVAYALKVRNKLTMGDQVGFFKLYESKAPLMCAYLLDMFVERERIAALNAFVKAYRPSLPVSTVSKWLAMDEDEFVQWMAEKKIAQLRVGGEVDCKALSSVTIA
ncbi:hypothetical protein PFISCL1PPCAC_12415, partial [Pristionchus fissidentatus]